MSFVLISCMIRWSVLRSFAQIFAHVVSVNVPMTITSRNRYTFCSPTPPGGRVYISLSDGSIAFARPHHLLCRVRRYSLLQQMYLQKQHRFYRVLLSFYFILFIFFIFFYLFFYYFNTRTFFFPLFEFLRCLNIQHFL